MSEFKQEQKVLAEELAKQVNALSEQKKKLQSEIKEYQAQIQEEEWKADRAIATAKERADREIAAIEASVLPHKGIQQAVDAARQQLYKLKQSMEQETARLKHERHLVLADLDSRITKQTAKLSRLHDEEAAFRSRVNA